MLVPMMQIGEVRMRVHQRLVHVLVAMRLGTIPGESVLVAMVRVVAMWVIMDEAIMNMGVAVALGQMQPDAASHQRQRDKERYVGTLAEHRERRHHSDEWRGRKVGARPGRTQLAQRDDEQDEAHAIAEEAKNSRRQRRL